MGEATFTFRVDETLKAAFAESARAQDRNAAQLLRDYMRSEVLRQQQVRDHDQWFRTQVEQALQEADDPAVDRISNEEARANMRKRRAELVMRVKP
jgi:hypothetical protein